MQCDDSVVIYPLENTPREDLTNPRVTRVTREEKLHFVTSSRLQGLAVERGVVTLAVFQASQVVDGII